MNFILFLLVIVFGAFLLRMVYQRLVAPARVTGVLVLAYAVILLLTTAVAYLVPPKDSDYSRLSVDEARMAYHQALTALFDGKMPDASYIRERQTWHFDYAGDRLEIDPSQYGEEIYVLVEKAPRSDLSVDVTYYSTPLVVYGKEYTDLTGVPEISLVKGRLFIADDRQPDHLKFIYFEQDPFISQYVRTDAYQDENNRYTMIGGVGLLHVSVPEHMDVTASHPRVILHHLNGG